MRKHNFILLGLLLILTCCIFIWPTSQDGGADSCGSLTNSQTRTQHSPKDSNIEVPITKKPEDDLYPQAAGTKTSRGQREIRVVLNNIGSEDKHRPIGVEVETVVTVLGNAKAYTLTSDNNGELSFGVESNDAAFVEITISSVGWRFQNANYRTAGKTLKLSFTTVLDEIKTVDVYKTHIAPFEIFYEDGLSYNGSIYYRYDSVPHELSISDGLGSLRARAGTKARIVVRSCRLEYGDVSLDIVVGEVGEVSHVVLKKISPSDLLLGGMLALVMNNNISATVSIEILAVENQPFLVSQTGLVFRSNDTVSEWPVESEYISSRLKPGEYKVVVKCNDTQPPKSAYSHCTVVGGKITVLKLNLESTGSILATLVDRQGVAPISGIASVEDISNVGDDMLHLLVADTGKSAIADSEGKLTLCGLPSGKHKLTFLAIGCLPKTITVFVYPDTTIELGVIVLERAMGSISITVKHHRAGSDQRYKVMLLTPGGGVTHKSVEFKGSSYRFEGLKYQKYTVSIKCIGGGFGAWSKTVEITKNNSEAEVEMVMKTADELRAEK